ncbi:MAG: NAD(P)/FAD-dependent oxidoreductase [Deltaproteobacteria bacterium]|nr:NAD(P)/FAD-dependent oxidoreductase [Deltaproteobacteria bacterium]
MHDVDVTVVGAGAVGLACAYEVAPLVKNLVILEKHAKPGTQISSRNSEVIHAGLYYPPDHLKTRLCIEGRRYLLDFCRQHQIPFALIGKLVVATNQQELQSIQNLMHNAINCGIEDLSMLSREEIKKLEPHIEGAGALSSPGTGIIDSHRLIKRLESLCLALGANMLYKTCLAGIDQTSRGFTCTVKAPDNTLYSFTSRVLINAAGLNSAHIAAIAGIDISAASYRLYPVKGEYFRVVSGKHRLVNSLIYPSPQRHLAGLGIHATKDLSGALRLGPNAFYVNELDYDVNPEHAGEFYESIHDIMPFLAKKDLVPDMAGVRPKLQAPGAPIRDFVVAHESSLGINGLVNLIGIESPGLTGCLAIGKMVCSLLRDAALI